MCEFEWGYSRCEEGPWQTLPCSFTIAASSSSCSKRQTGVVYFIRFTNGCQSCSMAQGHFVELPSTTSLALLSRASRALLVRSMCRGGSCARRSRCCCCSCCSSTGLLTVCLTSTRKGFSASSSGSASAGAAALQLLRLRFLLVAAFARFCRALLLWRCAFVSLCICSSEFFFRLLFAVRFVVRISSSPTRSKLRSGRVITLRISTCG